MFSKFKYTGELLSHAFLSSSAAAMAGLNVLGSQLSVVAKACLTYLKGDLDLVLNHTAIGQLSKAAAEAEDGKASLRIGSALLGRNIVYINSVLSASDNESFLRKLMDLPDKEARDPYQIFREVFGPSFFIGDNSEEGMLFHRKIKHYLNLQAFDPADFDHVEALYQSLASVELKAEDFPIMVRRNLRAFFAKQLFGFDLGSDLSDFFDSIETKMQHYHFYPALYLKFNSPVAAMRKEYLCLLGELFRNNIEALCERLSDNFQESKKTLLIDTIREKFLVFGVAADKEKLIQWLVNEPEIQMCVAGMFAVSNIADLISRATQNLFNQVNYQSRFHLKALTSELKEHHPDLSNCQVLRGSQSLNALNEFYLMNLRHNPPFNYICRYSPDEFKSEGMHIPANSVIFYKLKSAASRLDDVNNTSLHKGYLTPFGIGKRMCPAVNISELIFKFYIGSFVMLHEGIEPDLILQPVKKESDEEKRSDTAFQPHPLPSSSQLNLLRR